MNKREYNWRLLKNLASQAKVSGDFRASAEYLTKAASAAVNSNPEEVALILNGLAAVYFKIQEYGAAEVTAKESIKYELEFRDLDARNTNLADYYNMLSKILESQGKYSDAFIQLQKSVEIFISVLGAENDYVKGVVDHLSYLETNKWRG